MNYCCENCGWSEIIGSPIICHYKEHRTWRDECCEAWKPKGKETNMVEVVRCKDCKHFRKEEKAMVANQYCSNLHRAVTNDWFCADGER